MTFMEKYGNKVKYDVLFIYINITPIIQMVTVFVGLPYLLILGRGGQSSK